MCKFHYKFITNFIKSKYSANFLFRDSDSLVYEIETKDVYEDFYEDKNLLDFEDYLQDSMELHSKFFDFTNKLLVKWKMNSKEK